MNSRQRDGKFGPFYPGCTLCEAGVKHGWINYWGGHTGHYGIPLHQFDSKTNHGYKDDSYKGHCITCDYGPEHVIHQYG